MAKVRVYELARELEVKPGSIIDLLAEYGVSEKKTHSSSIDEDVAFKTRKRTQLFVYKDSMRELMKIYLN